MLIIKFLLMGFVIISQKTKLEIILRNNSQAKENNKLGEFMRRLVGIAFSGYLGFQTKK